MTTVLLTGVRGNTGRFVAPQLVARGGIEVRGGTQDPSLVNVDGVTPVAFSWSERATWGPAVEGVDTIYLARPEREDAPELAAALLDGAPHVRRVVLLSDNGHGDDPEGRSWAGRVENAVTARAPEWTLLRPSWFFQILSEERYFLSAVRDQSQLEIPTAGAAIAFTDARDIADAAVAAIVEDGHHGKAYTLTTSEAVTLEDLCARLSAAVGRPIRHVDAPLDQAVDSFANLPGISQWYVDYIRETFEVMRAGVNARIGNDLQGVTGKPARTWDAFIEQHAHLWRA